MKWAKPFRACCGFVWFGFATLCAAAELVAVAPLHSGSVYIYEVTKQKRLATLPVEDGAGVVGIAASPDGQSLYLVDGNVHGRLRKFNTRSWTEEWEKEFQNRFLALGAAQVVHLTADNRWLLIQTYDVGAAAAGIRVFDVAHARFAPAGLALRKCNRPLFASAADGTVAAVCPESVELLRAGPGETLAPFGEISSGIKQPSAVVMKPAGDALIILGARAAGTPWQLARLSTGHTQTAKSIDLSTLPGVEAQSLPDSQASILDVDRKGDPIAIVSGARIWLLEGDPIHVRRALQLPSPADGAQLSPDGNQLYTLRRDSATSAMLLGRTDLVSGSTRDAVLLQDLPLAPIVWRFFSTDAYPR